MPDTLRRPVWLTAAQREIVWACATFALSRGEDFPGRECIANFVNYMVDFRAQQRRPSAEVKLVVAGLKLPPDALPVMVSDEISNLLVIWGNLPAQVAHAMNPTPNWVPVDTDSVDGAAGGQSVEGEVQG